MTKFLLLFLAFLPLTAWSRPGWGPQTHAIVQQVSPQAVHLNTPALGTFWGGFKRYLPFTHNDGEIHTLYTPLFKSGEIRIYFSERKTSAPLYVFMPGIFGSADKGLTPLMIDLLEEIGGHVLVVPNILSTPYVAAHPLYGEDPIALEVQVMESALDFAQQRLAGRVTQVHVVAESLGTAVGSAWAAWDRPHKKRLNSLNLLWPQIKLPEAMKNFDKIIDEHRVAAKDCSTVFKLWLMAREFVIQDFPGTMSAEESACLGSVALVDGFITAAGNSWEAHLEAIQAEGPKPTGFEDFFRRYRPEMWALLEKQDERLSLAHWMRRLRLDPAFPVRIMTSKDDFLNFGLHWEAFKADAQHPTVDVLMMDWGGHSGPIAMKQFKDILRETLLRQ